MDDFFSVAPQRPPDSAHHPAPDPAADDVDKFAEAIAGRFSAAGRGGLLTARLSPLPRTLSAAPIPHLAMPSFPRQASVSTPLAHLSLSSPRRAPSAAAVAAPQQPSSVSDQFTVATAHTLVSILATAKVLVLDTRAHSAYSTARLPHAISLSVPSTLLKRPAFNLQKLSTMLSNSAATTRFNTWRTASRILVYDADTTVLQEGSPLLGLLRKFRKEGFQGDLAWLQGGIQGLWRDYRHLIEEKTASDDEDVEQDGENDNVLRARGLPISAFQQSSTNAPASSANDMAARHLDNQPQIQPSNRPMAANPFYDNIRQNIELSQGVTELIPLNLPPDVLARVNDLPFDWLKDIALASQQDETAEALAMQFYRIELNEQRRMQGIMTHHSQQSGGPAENKQRAFPYSITAGVEKGIKNRYRNIWPFEHARVRLQKLSPDDYVNASHIQPLGTRRRYIATQGPLPTTFSDFWTLVWEQDVRVIVMLTREIEGAVAKCGRYWQEASYGPLHLRLLYSSVPADMEETTQPAVERTGAFDFGVQDVPLEDVTIRRTFELRHSGYPGKCRVITQLQYLGWPDMNVPQNPDGLLKLIEEVDDAVERDAREDPTPLFGSGYESSSPDARDVTRPVLLHCSAGVGRTGGFIMVDAILDGLRREIRKTKRHTSKFIGGPATGTVHQDSVNTSSASPPTMMDVDDPPQRTIVFTNEVIAPGPSRTAVLPVGGPVSDSKLSTDTQRRSHASSSSHAAYPTDRNKGLVFHVPAIPRNSAAASMPTQPVSPYQLKDKGNIEVEKKGSSSGTARASKSNESQEQSSKPNAAIYSATIPALGDTRTPPALGRPPRPQSLTMKLPSSVLSHPHPFFPHPQSAPVMSSSGLFRGNVGDFTIADADLMFTSSKPDPAFAMDVETMPSWQAESDYTSKSGTGAETATGSDNEGKEDHEPLPTWPMQPVPEHLEVPSINAHGRFGSARRGHPASFSLSRPHVPTFNSSQSTVRPDTRFAQGFNSSDLQSTPVHASPLTRPLLSSSVYSSSGPSTSSFSSSSPSASGSGSGSDGVPLRPEFNQFNRMKDGFKRGSFGSHSHGSSSQRSSSSSFLSSSDGLSSFGSSGQRGSSSTSESVHRMSADVKKWGAGVDGVASSGDTTDATGDTSSFENSKEKSILHAGVSFARSKLAQDGTIMQSSESEENRTGEDIEGANTGDFKAPRELHRDDSPEGLSTFKDPIKHVLDDIREQRMSMCQSLRQYVFVHRAIIEGALRLVDEENERDRKRADVLERQRVVMERHASALAGAGTSTSMSTSSLAARTKAHGSVSFDLKEKGGMEDGSSYPAVEVTTPPLSSSNLYTHSEHDVSHQPHHLQHIQDSPNKGKRGASPTELPHEGKKGQVLLSKRPSIKRGKSVSSASGSGSGSGSVSESVSESGERSESGGSQEDGEGEADDVEGEGREGGGNSDASMGFEERRRGG